MAGLTPDAVAAMQSAVRGSRDDASHRRLPRSKKVDGRFVIDPSLFPGYVNHITENGFSKLVKWRRGMRGQAAPIPTAAELDAELPVRKPDLDALAAPPADRVQATWLGHASVLVQWDGWTVLADPIFSERCSPFQFAGPKRLRPSPVNAAELPPVDAILISHSHYDHLDLRSVRDLAAHHPRATFFVPLGLKRWFESNCAAAAVVEFDWGDELTLDERALGAERAGRPPLKIVCVPCQHWCKRTLTDTNRCLWCSWLVSTRRLTYFFGGDTGYCGEIWRECTEIYGACDLCAIPIGAYGVPAERWFHSPNHMDPVEAVECHRDLGSRQSVAIHWGTFLLTGEHIFEPPKKLAAAVAAKGLPPDSFVALGHGETRCFELLR